MKIECATCWILAQVILLCGCEENGKTRVVMAVAEKDSAWRGEI